MILTYEVEDDNIFTKENLLLIQEFENEVASLQWFQATCNPTRDDDGNILSCSEAIFGPLQMLQEMGVPNLANATQADIDNVVITLAKQQHRLRELDKQEWYKFSMFF